LLSAFQRPVINLIQQKEAALCAGQLLFLATVTEPRTSYGDRAVNDRATNNWAPWVPYAYTYRLITVRQLSCDRRNTESTVVHYGALYRYTLNGFGNCRGAAIDRPMKETNRQAMLLLNNISSC